MTLIESTGWSVTRHSMRLFRKLVQPDGRCSMHACPRMKHWPLAKTWCTGALLQLRWGPLAGTGHIPTDEMEMATHLYLAIQAFFRRYEDLQQRPFIITGVRPAQLGTSRAVAVAGRVDCQGQHMSPDQRVHVALRTCSAPTNVAGCGRYCK